MVVSVRYMVSYELQIASLRESVKRTSMNVNARAKREDTDAFRMEGAHRIAKRDAVEVNKSKDDGEPEVCSYH